MRAGTNKALKLGKYSAESLLGSEQAALYLFIYTLAFLCLDPLTTTDIATVN